MKIVPVLVALLLASCTSPEATRERGGGPGADTGNRGVPVMMHEGAKPYAGTPTRIGVEHAPLQAAQQQHELSVQ